MFINPRGHLPSDNKQLPQGEALNQNIATPDKADVKAVVAKGRFIAILLTGPLVTAFLLSSNPVIYLFGTISTGAFIYAVSRFVGFFIKRNPDYYINKDYIEENE
jgi:hypothetical protein